MSSNYEDRYKGRWVLALILIILSMTLSAPGQRGGRLSSQRFDPADFASSRPQLLNADSNPTLRYPIANFSGWSVFSASYGWLDVSREAVHYNVVSPPSKAKEGFELPYKEIRELKLARGTLTFHGRAKKYNIFYMRQDRWGSIHSGSGFLSASAENAPGTSSISLALRDFDQVLALVKPPAAPSTVVAQPVAAPPPEPKPAAPPAPPTIVLSAPSGAGANQVIELKESPLVIRGVAMDSTGIPVVSINGALANMRPQNTQAAEFWTDPLPLQSGGNRFQIVASNSAHVETQLVFIVHYTPKPPPDPRALSKPQIIALLQGGVLSGRIAAIIKERSIKFTPTPDDLNDLRAAGADDELIEAIQQAAPAR
jgi:hypothetical protein